MVIKEKIPITYFQKVKDIVENVMPNYFESVYPDVDKFNKTLQGVYNVIKKKPEKKDLKKYYAAHDFGELIMKALNCAKTRLEDTVALLERNGHREDKFLTLKKKDYDTKVLDQLYMTKTCFSISEDDVIILEKEDKNDDYKSDINKMVLIFHKFNRGGRKTFRIEEQLQHELFLTDVNNVDSIFLKLPYPCICFYLPFNNKLTIRNEIIEYAYLSEIVQLGGSNSGSKKLKLIYVTKSGAIESHLFLIKDGMLLSQIEDQINKRYQSPLAKKEAKEIISLVLASVLYMNSNEVTYRDVFPMIISKKQDSRFPVCSLGYDIKINKELHYLSHSNNTDRHLNVLKWTVRGHFRTYRKGERYKQNKTIWIRPFLKGREREDDTQIIKLTNYLVE